MSEVENALLELLKGRPILIYDSLGREEETDIVLPAEFVKPEYVRMLRKDGGGLICVSLHSTIADRLGIPFLTDIWRDAMPQFPALKELWPDDIPYDEKSAFSITINHRNTFTGISDNDRSLTITELAKIGKRVLDGEYISGDLGREFRSPGHVILLRAAEGLLHKRKGHTELSVAMMELAGLTPISTICEMLGDDGKSLRISDARQYAEKHGYSFIEGREAMDFYLETVNLPLS